jgi:hypothetical protein
MVEAMSTGTSPDGEDLRDDIPVITDRSSFDAVTGPDCEVSGLYAYAYAYAKLDRLIDLACLVAADFFRRPHRYTTLTDDEMPARLARLNSRIGCEEYLTSSTERAGC